MDKKATNTIIIKPLSNDNTTPHRPKNSGPKTQKKLPTPPSDPTIIFPNHNLPPVAQSNNRICVRTGNLGKTNKCEFVKGLETSRALGLNCTSLYGDRPTIYSNGTDNQTPIIIRPSDSIYTNNKSHNQISNVTHSESYVQSPQCIEDILYFGNPKNKSTNHKNVELKTVEKTYYSLQHQFNNRYEQNTEWGRRTFEMVQADTKSHHYISEKVNKFKILGSTYTSCLC
jgi:hypothetical protein